MNYQNRLSTNSSALFSAFDPRKRHEYAEMMCLVFIINCQFHHLPIVPHPNAKQVTSWWMIENLFCLIPCVVVLSARLVIRAIGLNRIN